jgi:hypothetical protein
MEDEQDLVASILRSMPPPVVRGGFVARVDARIDLAAAGGWLALADFRLWTLRLAPAAIALALLAALWPPASSAATSTTTSSSVSVSIFSPASASDWQKDVSGNALLEAALTPRGAANVR